MKGFPRTLLAGVAFLTLLSATRASAKPRFESAITTDNRDTRAEKSVFAPETLKVYIVYVAVDVPKGTKLKAIWFAEKVEGIKDNSQIVSAESTSAGGTQMGLFSYGKPGSGWPAGTYRVDLHIEDKMERQVRFKVAK